VKCLCQKERYRSEPTECVFQTFIVNSNLVLLKMWKVVPTLKKKINFNRFSLVNICKRKYSSTTCVDEMLDVSSVPL